MSEFLTAHEATLRSGLFFGLLLALLLVERWRPRRRQHVRWRHFFGNLGIGVGNSILLRLLVPGGLVVVALSGQHTGLLARIDLPLWMEFIGCLILLDLSLYWQHRLFHRLPFFWAFHSAHHGDRTLNVSSALRFHPGEALLSFVIKAATIWLLGAPVAAVIAFEVLLNGAAMFNHTNWSLGRFDAVLQKLIVTPDMHRLHHSRQEAEAQHNFGFFLSVWDRLFASYQAEPQQDHGDIELGLADMPDDGWRATLKQPLKLLR
ncbi:MAG: sterol desaturase family protein [Parvibaculales bacterium]